MQLTKKSRIVPKRGHKSDKYEGSVDPITKLRHGHGLYHYDNTFFTYEGNYNQGKKSGEGTLKMKDGTIIKATFEEDQMNGLAEICYSHGAIYKGNLAKGEKSGQGIFKSDYEEYDGQWKENCKHGQGNYTLKSTNEEYNGQFQRDKFHGKGKLTKWNYTYEGMFSEGLKEGEGTEINDWTKEEGQKGLGRFSYTGGFSQDKFQGEGIYKSRQSDYIYNGQFEKGEPILYPNEFRVFLSMNSKNGEEVVEGEKTLVEANQGIEYELEGDSFNLYVETVYQGPEELDPVQPTPEEIDNLIKNWQNENKKNKNPPPMPDFNQPRMKKPNLVLVSQESGRTISFKIIKTEGNEESMKIDYRKEMIAKRKENEQLRQDALKKAEEDGGKKGGKKDNKGQPELKVNLFNPNPSFKQTILNLSTKQGTTILKQFELPDDFPPGKFLLSISSPFTDFGTIKALKKDLTVKVKTAKKK